MVRMQAIGNLGKDAVTNTVNGKTVINFSIAHTDKGRDKDENGNPKDKTIWVDCAYWTEKTGVTQYLKKGTQIYVEGQPDIRTYTTQDGRTGASLTLRVGNLQLLGSRSGDGNSVDSGNLGGSIPPPQVDNATGDETSHF